MTGNNTGPVLTARQVAFETLRRLDIKKHDTSRQLNRWISRTDQHGRTTDLVFGVIRNLSLLDKVLQKAAGVTKKHIDPQALAILRIGAYELLYTPDTAEHSIIYEAVELAASVGSKKSAGFVNALLRGVQRLIENRRAEIDDQNLQRIVPTKPGFGCLLKEKILPGKSSDPAQYLGETFSMPQWLAEQWTKQFGVEAAQQICFASNRSPGVAAWPNTLRINASDLAEVLQSENIQAKISSDGTMLRLSSLRSLDRLKSFQDGLFYIQDPSAAKTTLLLDPKPSWRILDLCAAPGTKTIAIALQMQGKGQIIATDRDAARLEMVEQNRRRLGLENIKTAPPQAPHKLLNAFGPFDAVLADVPCSNTGVLARRVEARYRLTEKNVNALAEIQKKLLLEALDCVHAEGRVLYSTCSILPQENQRLVAEVLTERADVCLAAEELTLPAVEKPDAFDHDGAYAALLIKK